MNKKALFILPPERFNEAEFEKPKHVLNTGGVEVVVASTKVGEIVGDYDGVAISTTNFTEVTLNDYDLIAVIGGSGTIDHLWQDTALLELLKEAYSRNIMISGICAGSVVISKTGVLKGRNGTCYPIDLMKDALKENQVHYLEQNVVEYSDVITSNGPDGAIDFGKALLDYLR